VGVKEGGWGGERREEGPGKGGGRWRRIEREESVPSRGGFDSHKKNCGVSLPREKMDRRDDTFLGDSVNIRGAFELGRNRAVARRKKRV